jgi:RND family efflux transporter MFP subunit
MTKKLPWLFASALRELSSNHACRLMIYGAVISFVTFDAAHLSAQPAIEGVRSVKVDRVKSASESQVRDFVGEVQPVRYWALGFEVTGRITEVMFREGDEVKKGQILARLDKSSYKLKLMSAEADLLDSESNLVIAKKKLLAQEDLNERGFTSTRVFERAQSELSAYEASVASRRVIRDLAQRSLDSTDLIAPADGIVAKRSGDPFVDVTAGQVVMRIDILGEVQVAVRVPANLMQRTERGLLINIRANGQNYKGAVSEVAARVEAGNAFQVIVAVEGANAALRPGMTANVQFRYERQAGAGSKIMIPLRSILPGSKPMEGYVFVYDVEQKTLRKTQVNIIDLNSNYLEVVSGLKEGDLIAVAGVAFLADGQRVSIFNPSILRGSDTIKSGPSGSVR